MKVLKLVSILMMFIVFSCKKDKTNTQPSSAPGTPPTIYPCPAPNFTNVINVNGQKLVKVRSLINLNNPGELRRSTSFLYYDSFNRLVSIKTWDTINNPNLIYTCREDQYQYNSFGKVLKQTQYSEGNASPRSSYDYIYDATPQLKKIVSRTNINSSFESIDTAYYAYYPGKIERNDTNGQTFYYINSTNNIDSVDFPFDIPYIYTYDGKVNPLKDFFQRLLPFNSDENVVDIMSSSMNILSSFTYTYNSNNLPLISSRINEKTYYFYE